MSYTYHYINPSNFNMIKLYNNKGYTRFVPFYNEKGHLCSKINYDLAWHSRGQLHIPAKVIVWYNYKHL